MTYFFTYFSSMPDVPGAYSIVDNVILEEFIDVDSYEIDEMPVYVITNDETNEMVFAEQFRKYISNVFPTQSDLVWLSPLDLTSEHNLSRLDDQTLKVREFLLSKGYYN